MKGFGRTLLMGGTLAAVGVHVLEDVLLISLGAWVPIPVWLKYVVGISASWLVFGCIIHRIKGEGHD